MTAHGPYRGTRVSLLTQHGKEQVMAPLLSEALGAEVELATGFDTDTLGTFTREIPRPGLQLATARAKAEKGMEILGLDCGLASEGAFGPDPYGLFVQNLELVVWVDRSRGIEVVGRAQAPGHHLHARVTDRAALDAFAHKAGFPTHGLVVRPDHEDDPRMAKGLTTPGALHQAFDEALAASHSRAVWVESDLRAHMNPTRMGVIRAATADLVARLQSHCPKCDLPGFWKVERLPGRPCSVCGSPTAVARAERWACATGAHSETRDLDVGVLADPSRCDLCNP